MQLVLFQDVFNLRYARVPNDNTSLSLHITKGRPKKGEAEIEKGDYDLSDEEKLVSQIWAKAERFICSVSILVKIFRNARAIKMIVKPSSDPVGKNIFHVLLQLFPEVTISVFIKRIASGFPDVDLASVEGMKIDEDTICSVGFAPTKLTSFDVQPSPPISVQLVANVADTISKGISFVQEVLEKESFSDVIISAENGAEIKAHKSFLSVCSPVMEAMFRSKMEESQTGRVDMTDLSEAGVRALLRYVYHGDLREPKVNIQVAYDMFYAAHKYGIRGLESEMRAALMKRKNKRFGVKLALKMYMFTRNIESATELKKKATQILKAKIDELMLLQEYKDLFEKPSNSKIAMQLSVDLVKTASVGCTCVGVV